MDRHPSDGLWIETLDTLELIATSLGVSPAWLAYGEGPRELHKRGGASRRPL